MSLTTNDIDALIISHLDYDHFEGITAFESSRAPVYLHLAALEWHLSRARRYPILRLTGMPSPQEVDTALRFMDSDRFRLIACGHAQMTELDAGLSVIRVDGHYDGLLSVVVKTTKGLVVLAGDSSYLYSNLEKKWPGA
jgi:metal-dependent hydrolase (beta-lactamase superfamily II)